MKGNKPTYPLHGGALLTQKALSPQSRRGCWDMRMSPSGRMDFLKIFHFISFKVLIKPPSPKENSWRRNRTTKSNIFKASAKLVLLPNPSPTLWAKLLWDCRVSSEHFWAIQSPVTGHLDKGLVIIHWRASSTASHVTPTGPQTSLSAHS